MPSCVVREFKSTLACRWTKTGVSFEDIMKERVCQNYKCMYNDKRDFEQEKKV